MLTLGVESIRRQEWRRKGTGQADSILTRRKLSLIFSVNVGLYAWQPWRQHTYDQTDLPNWWTPDHVPRFPISRKDVMIPYVVNHFCHLYGTHWCRLQHITSWPLRFWIMTVTWLYLSLTFSRLGLRNLGMWAWARTLKVYKVFTKAGQGPWPKSRLCLGPLVW